MAELKSLQTGRTESERGRKRAEGQLQELGARLAQADRERDEREERVHKLQVQTEHSEKYSDPYCFLLEVLFSVCSASVNLSLVVFH